MLLTVSCHSQASLSVEFSGQEYWSGYPFPPPGDLPDPGIKLTSPAVQADSLPSEPPGSLTLPGLLSRTAPGSHCSAVQDPRCKKGVAGLTEKLPCGRSVGW